MIYDENMIKRDVEYWYGCAQAAYDSKNYIVTQKYCDFGLAIINGREHSLKEGLVALFNNAIRGRLNQIGPQIVYPSVSPGRRKLFPPKSLDD